MQHKKRTRLLGLSTALLLVFSTPITGLAQTPVESDALFLKNYQKMDVQGKEFVSRPPMVAKEMMTPEFWQLLHYTKGEDITKVLMSEAEIQLYNHKAPLLLQIGELELTLQEMGAPLPGVDIEKIIKNTFGIPKNPEKYLLQGTTPTTAEYWQTIAANANLANVPETVTPQFAISVTRGNFRKLPTADTIIVEGDSLYYDDMLQSDLLPGMPLVVVHESLDGLWNYVFSYGYSGWIPKSALAMCPTKEDWLSRQNVENFLIVTGDNVRISTDPYHPQLSGLLLPMGTKLEVLPVSEETESIHKRTPYGNYVVKMPIRLASGMISDQLIPIPEQADVHLGYLPYTQANVINLAYKHLGNEYGWAGTNNAQDCSSMTRAIFSCFGFNLPRTSSTIGKLTGLVHYDVKGLPIENKTALLDTLPAGTILYFPGHIMIYLGTVNNTPYCISAVGSFATKDMEVGTALPVTTVVVTSMNDVTRRSGLTWLDCIETMVVLTN